MPGKRKPPKARNPKKTATNIKNLERGRSARGRPINEFGVSIPVYGEHEA